MKHHAVWSVKENEFPVAGAPRDQLLFLLHYGILAPSAHNAQPWKCSVEDSRIDVLIDPRFALPVSDPIGRQTLLSLGAFTANLVLAAQAFGLKADVTWYPESSMTGVVVSIEFSGFASASIPKNSQVLTSIIDRRVNRAFYGSKPLTNAVIETIKEVNSSSDFEISITTGQEKISRLARCVSIGMAFAFKGKLFRRELSQFITANTSDKKVGIPGYTAGLGLIASHVIPRFMWSFDIGSSQAKLEERRFLSSPAIMVIGANQDSPKAWLQTGYLYQEVALTLTRLGVDHALAGAPIEAPTVPQKVQQIIESTYRPLMFVRLGYAKQRASHSPRRPISDILL